MITLGRVNRQSTAGMLLQRFFDVSQSPDVETFERRLVTFAQELDFGIISAAMVINPAGPTGRPVFVSVGNTPEAFLAASKNVDNSVRDPVLRRLKNMSVPFIYDQDLYVREGASDLWEEQAPFGFKTGIAVALHLPGSKHFVLGVDRQSPLPKDESVLTRMMADLQLLAVHAQDAADRLLVAHDALSEHPGLTPRELEVLKWAMAGKTAWEVGRIVGISEYTVNFHTRNAFKKLNVKTKTQAVLKAASLGLL